MLKRSNIAQGSDKKFLRAQRIAFQLLKFRARSQKEIIDKLKKKKISQGVIKKTVAFLKKADLLDDYKFARSWVKSSLSKQLGTRRILFELKQKGIREKIIEEVIGAIQGKYRESDVAVKLAQKKLASLEDIDKFKARQRIYAFLVRKGFSFDVVNGVIEQMQI